MYDAGMPTTKKSAAGKKKQNNLGKLEGLTADKFEKRRKTGKKRGVAGRTRAAADTRKRKRKAPPVPKNKSAAEIAAMDPESPEFKHPQGRPRKKEYLSDDTSGLTLSEIANREKQASKNSKRAKQRKHEAVVEAIAREELPQGNNQPTGFADDGSAMYAEDTLISDGKLSLDDWDSQELIRGYRRNRDGKFGEPPKYIPREVQQEAFRRLVRIGERKLRQEYLNIIDELVKLATDDTIPAKVRLEAIKEIQNRTVGKTPEVVVTTEAPWQDMLVDSLIPVDEMIPLDVRGTVQPSLPSGDGGGSQPSAASAIPARESPPSSDGSGRSSGSTKPTRKAKTRKTERNSKGEKTLKAESDLFSDDDDDEEDD